VRDFIPDFAEKVERQALGMADLTQILSFGDLRRKIHAFYFVALRRFKWI
jgi:hypothetical protein